MADPLVLYAGTLLGATLAGTLLVLPRMRRIARIQPGSGDEDAKCSVAVVVAAKDEEDSIQGAMESLLRQADRDLRIVAVNDRSGDRTGEILDHLAAGHDALTVLHIDALPAGWLGKNHALARGAAVASAGESPPEFLLFTDADVHFVPGGVRAAVQHAGRQGLDHLAGAPRVHASSLALAGQIASFGVLFGLFTRPWSVPDPRSSAYVGIGALNLVRRTAYEDAGGHAAIAMRIDDDLRLGKRIKEAGGASAFAFAGEIASLTWYPSLSSMLRGLHKNAFAGIDFRLSVAAVATVLLSAIFIAPFLIAAAPPAFLGVSPLVRALCAATAALHLYGAADAARSAGLPARSALFFPFGIALFLLALWRSAMGALLTGRVVWRGTAYDLAELKRACPAPTESA